MLLYHSPVDAWKGYIQWYNNGEGVDAWDTGPMSRQLFMAYISATTSRRNNNFNITVESLESQSMKLDQRLRGLTAGVNAAHRVSPLALAWFMNERELIEAARQESRLTHWSLLSQDTCVIVVVLCRHLLNGIDIDDAIQNILSRQDELCPLTPVIMIKLKEGLKGNRNHPIALERNPTTTGGFCPEVLKAAIHFVSTTDSFEDALELSIGFAGPSNYCPVLVGAIAGAMYGASKIPNEAVSHCKPGVNSRCLAVGSKCCSGN